MKFHKRLLENPPLHPPTREEFWLPSYDLLPKDQLGAAEALIQKEVDRASAYENFFDEETRFRFLLQLKEAIQNMWDAVHTEPLPVGEGKTFPSLKDASFLNFGKKMNFSDNFLMLLASEKKYQSAKRDYSSYQTWVKERNPKRAVLEAKLGFDAKNALHCIRLYRMGLEMLETGNVNVFRSDADELKEIRAGVYSYEQIIESIAAQEKRLKEAEKDSKLPLQPDLDLLKPLCYEMIMEFSFE